MTNTIPSIQKWFEKLGFAEDYSAFLPSVMETAKKHPLEEIDISSLMEQQDFLMNLTWLLSRCDELEHKYNEHSIDHGVFLDTISDIKVWTDVYYRYSGRFGLEMIAWLKKHFEFSLFKLGRLQFAFGKARESDSAQELTEGENIIEMHIQEGAPLTISDCLDSFRAANMFFKTCFPKYEYRFYACHSWILDENVHQFLKPDSNIVQFAKLFDPVISLEESYALLRYLFRWNDTKETVLTHTPQNRLQENIIAHLKNGGKLYEGYAVQTKQYFENCNNP